jgi:hypothetical protein
MNTTTTINPKLIIRTSVVPRMISWAPATMAAREALGLSLDPAITYSLIIGAYQREPGKSEVTAYVQQEDENTDWWPTVRTTGNVADVFADMVGPDNWRRVQEAIAYVATATPTFE